MSTTRIRTIKPEFFGSPDTAKASFKARILYAAMWCWSDDWGYGETKIKALNGFAFERDDLPDSEVEALLREVAKCWGVVFYVSDGREYYSIPKWEEHQKTQRRSKRRFPDPDEPGSTPDLRFTENLASSSRSQGNSEAMQGDVASGTGEQGNRGTGEQGKGARKRATRLNSEWQPDPDVNATLSMEHPTVDLDAEFLKFQDYWVAKAGRDATKMDWNATWRNWVRNARNPALKKSESTSKADGWLQYAD